MEIVVGSYEELVLGYRIVKGECGNYVFETSFTDHSHTASVRAVAVSGRGILATGSSDETIRLFSLKNRHEIGTLMQHEGSINGLHFYGKNHLFSCSDDGTICVWQVGKWECLRTLHGHKGPVYDISVHPSGKMALSIGKDKTLRIWNLITGKRAYITNMKHIPEYVQWSPGGDTYLVCFNNQLDVYQVETAAVVHCIPYPGRIHASVFIKPTLLAVGGEGGTVQVHDLDTQKAVMEFETGTNRIKGMAHCKSLASDNTWLVTVSSDGFIKLWELDSNKAELTAEVNTTFRLLSVAIHTAKSSDRGNNEKVEVKEEAAEPDERDESSDLAEENVEEKKVDRKVRWKGESLPISGSTHTRKRTKVSGKTTQSSSSRGAQIKPKKKRKTSKT